MSCPCFVLNLFTSYFFDCMTCHYLKRFWLKNHLGENILWFLFMDTHNTSQRQNRNSFLSQSCKYLTLHLVLGKSIFGSNAALSLLGTFSPFILKESFKLSRDGWRASVHSYYHVSRLLFGKGFHPECSICFYICLSLYSWITGAIGFLVNCLTKAIINNQI